ncbi:MAG TPA: glycosyltransferase family 4 protein, partial [Gemmataceae bacterium]|nr:glycosyltransferase family 4 protein [Gemmataceae bacterium]
ESAEQSLREVLEIDPSNREARHNLQILLGKRHKEVGAEVKKEFQIENCKLQIENDGEASPDTESAVVHVPSRKCLRIGLASFYPRPFRTETPYKQPLGGSESALCYLAEALAGKQQEVFLLSAAGETGVSRGVACLPLTPEGLREIPPLDFFIVQNLCGKARVLRQALGSRTRLIFWTGHGPEQPAVQALRDPGERAAYDAFVFVSDWQRGRYKESFAIDPSRAFVLGNAISPAFQNLFGPDESILAAKAQLFVLAYTSTPDRGLELLLEGFPRIRKAMPGITLQVFSGLRLYGFSEAQDEAQYGALYRKCRETEGVESIGPVPQPELARRLRRVSVLAYPNTVPETFCIAVLEAMAAGCCVVTSQLGALPETTAGFGRLIPMDGDKENYLDRFVEKTLEVLHQLGGPGKPELENHLRRQVKYVNENCTWPLVAEKWIQWIKGQ